VTENDCAECERLVAAYRACIFEAHDLRNQAMVLEAAKAPNRTEHSQQIIDVEGRAAALKRELSEHQKNEHAKR